MVAVGDQNRWVGEDHPRAKLSNRQIDAIRDAHELGVPYSLLAQLCAVSTHSIGRICRFERRACVALGYKKVE